MSTLSLPPLETLDRAAAHLIDQAAGDASAERAINKALWNLQSGIEIRSTCGGFLLPSSTRANVIHRVSTMQGCNCEAGNKGNLCWHVSAIAILQEAQKYTRPTMPAAAARPTVAKLLAAARARLEMDELFA